MDTRAVVRKEPDFRSFAEFYPFYLSEHRNTVSRVLHFIGTWGAVLFLVALIFTGEPWFAVGTMLCGYGFAWVGHFRFERNRPATFRYPFYSLAGDFRMWWELNLGKLKFREQ
ncbi:MAG TPA: DUF962 domain-containing protein [Steroidobacteraceae bacterium]|nr:DUF962 domain-containing protein [Steroidobacteraceae bacterium]